MVTDKHITIQASPSHVSVPCDEAGCGILIECEIDVRVILEPVVAGRRMMYALGKPDTQPIWDHMLVFHGPEEWATPGYQT